LIVLGDARGHETGKQGNRFANPGQKKLPTHCAIGSGRIDTEVCEGTAGVSSLSNHGTTRPREPEQSRRPPARYRCAPRRTITPSRRSATTTAAASSSAAIAFDWT
jgi:hypothetical protein